MRSKSVATVLVGAVALAVAALGITGAIAQSQDAPTGATPDALLERLYALELDLPPAVPPTGVTLTPEETWGTLAGDAGGAHAVLGTLEADLRSLAVDADAAATGDDPALDVARAVAYVAQGWLDVWTGTGHLAEAEAHDLAFPTDARDDEGVATGADEPRGWMEVGLDLILLGQARHLDGYVGLRTLGEAPPEAQARFDARAAAAEDFDRDLRPYVVAMLSWPTTSVLVPVDRFETPAPGVNPRARAVTMVCLDREAVQEAGGVVTPEVLASLGEEAVVDRPDCGSLVDPQD